MSFITKHLVNYLQPQYRNSIFEQFSFGIGISDAISSNTKIGSSTDTNKQLGGVNNACPAPVPCMCPAQTICPTSDSNNNSTYLLIGGFGFLVGLFILFMIFTKRDN